MYDNTKDSKEKKISDSQFHRALISAAGCVLSSITKGKEISFTAMIAFVHFLKEHFYFI